MLFPPVSPPEEHPYAQVQNVPKTESTAHRNISGTGGHVVVDLAVPSTSQSGGACSLLPIAPPRSRRSSSHNSLLMEQQQQPGPVPDSIQAASAITGGVQANQDLPYMTPPLLMHSLPQPPQPPNGSPPQQRHFSGDSQDSSEWTVFFSKLLVILLNDR